MSRTPIYKRSASPVTTASAIVLALAAYGSEGSATAGPASASAEHQSSDLSERVAPDHLSPDTTIKDLLAHPAFEGHAQLLLPWDQRAYDPKMPLSGMASLMPYHSEVVPVVAVSAINHIVDDIAGGHQVFYDFSRGGLQGGNASGDTGLFFFRGNPGAPFAVVAPGGGFAYVGSLHEGFPYAQEISRAGYNAFVLKYRASLGGQAATEDLAEALSWIFAHADELGVGTDGYSLWGSSAGARMVAAIGSHGAERFRGAAIPKPATVITAYTAHSDVGADEPPTFVVVGQQDGIAPPAAMQRRVSALQALGTPVEYHEFPNVGHGFGLGTGTSAAGSTRPSASGSNTDSGDNELPGSIFQQQGNDHDRHT